MDDWTNQCGCGNYMPDSYDKCDYCKLKKYGLLDLICAESPDVDFREIAAALRRAEDIGRAEEKSRRE